jgi:metallo-beta-lactamase family protein
MTISLKFCGAAGTVTGSCYLLSHPGGNLLVDCGLFQGPKTLRELNYGRLPFEAAAIDAVLVTHAHIDHSGLLPKLCAEGYTGRIVATAETNALLEWMLPDSGAIQEGEVERLNQRNVRRGRPAVEPIYTRADAEAVLPRLDACERDVWREVMPGVRARFRDAGHILGAVSIELEVATGDPSQRFLRLLFSGDVGPDVKAFHGGPEGSENFDYVIVEATYGDRERPAITEDGRRAALKAEILGAQRAGGNLLIPAFAVERTQELLADLAALTAKGEIPAIPTFLDSPLAIRATEVFQRFGKALRLPADVVDPFHAPHIRFVTTAEQSMALDRIAGGAIIIAASGLCDAGRIRYHLKSNLWRPDATVMLIGYQAPGTMGALLQAGVASVRIHGQEVKVTARIRSLDTYSGHADRTELLAWMRARLPVFRGVFITHGEEKALASLKQGILGLGLDREVIIPRLDQTFALHPAAKPRPIESREPERLDATGLEAIRQGRDWHNDYASFVLDLQDRLSRIADERGRRVLLRRVREALNTSLT